MAQLTGRTAPPRPLPMGREFGRAERAMIKGYSARHTAASKAKAAVKPKRGRPKKVAEPLPPPNPLPAEAQPFPLMIPEQLRTCLMAKEDVETAVRRVLKEVIDEFEARQGQRKVYMAEAMERLNVDSRSTMWHWNAKGYLKKETDANGHVFYREYKIQRAERGEHPEGEQEEPQQKKGGSKHGKR